jgi:hypothetical protein
MQLTRMTLATPYKPFPKPAFGLGDGTEQALIKLKNREQTQRAREQAVG